MINTLRQPPHIEIVAGDPGQLTLETRVAIRRRTLFVVFYNLALFGYLFARPGTYGSLRAIDNIAQAVGAWIAAQWVFWGLFRKDDPAWAGLPDGKPIVRRWAVFWIGMGSLCYAIGQSIWTFYECVLHESPQPSVADLFYFGVAPCFLAGILMLPARPIPAASRTRIVLDGMVIMTATITFSWYFLVGPMLLDARAPLVARILGAIYAMQPYLLVYSLLRLSARSGETVLRPAVRILSAGLAINLVTESVYGFLLQHNAYKTGSILDTGFPLGMMAMFLGAYAARKIAADPNVRAAEALYAAAPGGSAGPSAPSVQHAGRTLLPYALVPVVWAFALVIGRFEHNRSLNVGVYVGAGVLVALTLLRQAFAILENASLYNRLHEAYDSLAENNRRAIEHAESMRKINAELKSVQNELVHSAKLASLGTLATGIAHELNQPLAVIRGMVQQLLGEPVGEEMREDLTLIEGQTTRMMKIIQHLRTFARAGSDDRKRVDVNRVVRDCFILVGAQLKSNGVRVDMELSPDDPAILGDANELEQVLLNLITNARDAMDGAPDPCIRISTRAAGGECRIVCRDNGPGIPDEIAAQVFDPFFTTKEPGKGTGLGLSISHSIIRKHHGTIHVENSGGAIFTVTLPLAESETPSGSSEGRAASLGWSGEGVASLKRAA